RLLFFFSSRRRHTRSKRDWSSDVCSSDLVEMVLHAAERESQPVELVVHFQHTAVFLGVPGGGRLFIGPDVGLVGFDVGGLAVVEIGRASCRERVWGAEWAGAVRERRGRVE